MSAGKFNIEKFYALRFIKLYLNSCGVSTNYESKSVLFPVYKYYLLTCFSILTYGQLMHYQNVNGFPEFAKTTVFVFSAFYLNYCTLHVHFKRKQFGEIIRLKNDNFYTYSNLVYDLHGLEVDEKFRNIVQKYGKIWASVYSVVETVPLIVTPFSEYELGSPETLMIPCKFPWKANTPVSYLLTYLLQLNCIAPISFPVFGMVFFSVYFLLEMRAQSERICLVIREIKSMSQIEALVSTSRKFAMSTNTFDKYRYSENKLLRGFLVDEYNKISLQKLIHCLKHHQKIVRFINNFVSCVEAMFLGDLLYSVGTITFVGYTLVGGMVHPSWYMQYLALVSIGLLYLLLYCHIGEVINDCNYHIKEALYNTDWYELNTDYRKTLALFICNIENCRKLKTCKSYIASYELFTSILKACYTYMNLLLQSFSR
ncbi:uncharacterized protein LOC135841892 [Planococcus citri]|uniref:uncharacterized protein LOC135841892 n=1 Tax=Planococcus citri TaxID=170843 RepID=UPI0031F82F0E